MSVPSLARFKACTKCKCWKPAIKTFFAVHKTSKYGLTPECKICRLQYRKNHRAIAKEYNQRYREANKEAIAEYARQYREENYNAVMETQRLWREANREAMAEYARRRQIENPKIIAEIKRRYREKNHDRLLVEEQQYREENRERIKKNSRRPENLERARVAARRWHEENKEQARETGRRYRENNKSERRAKGRRYRARKLNAEHEPYNENDINQMWHDQGGLCAYCETSLFGVYHIEHVIPLSRGGADKLENLVVSCPLCNFRKSTKTGEEFIEILTRELKFKTERRLG